MKKTLGLWDVVWMNVTAIIGLRWLPLAAAFGASSTIIWVIAAMLFFLPLSFVAIELATAWPEQGGMYVWVTKAFGEKYGFLTSWLYWVNSFIFGPALLTMVAIGIAFVTKPELAANKFFVASLIIGVYWAVIFLNLHNMRTIKLLPDLAGPFGTVLPGLVIIVLGFVSVLFWHHPIATDYSLHNWIPHLGGQANIVFLTGIMFSMAGMELVPTMAGETKDPGKIFPRAALISAVFIVGIYIIGTMALNFILSPEKISAANGIFDALRLVSKNLGIPFIFYLITILFTFGNIGGVSVWVTGSIKMLFESTKEGVLPPSLTKLNKNGMPANGLIAQGLMVTIITISGIVLLPTVNAFYETLVMLTTIIYFLPYLFMFTAFLSLRKTHPHVTRPYRVPGGFVTASIIALTGLLSVVAALVLSVVLPPDDIKTAREVLNYRLEIILPTLFFWVVGVLIYRNYSVSRSS